MNSRKVLLGVCILGIVLSLGLLGGLINFSRYSGSGDPAPAPSGENTLTYKLREYDRLLADAPGTAPEQLNRLLDDMERDALGVESHLSVLKRRRALALGDTPSRDASETGPVRRRIRLGNRSGRDLAYTAYLAAAERAAAAFPYSEPLAAVAAEAASLFGLTGDRGDLPLTGPAAETALRYAAILTEGSYTPLALSVYALSGSLETPAKAAAIPRGGELLSRASEFTQIGNWEALIADAALLHILNGDTLRSGPLIQSLLENQSYRSAEGPDTGEVARFAAEFYYDFGDPGRAAELFSRLTDDRSVAREADALWLAGRPDAAGVLWTVLVYPRENAPETADPGVPADTSVQAETLIRSFYNLAAVSDAENSAAYLQRLLDLDPNHLYGLIRYTRLLDTATAIAALEGSPLFSAEPLLGLERLRRRQEEWAADRIVPETWLLINQYPGEENLYRWGCYYFDFQRQYDETARLIHTAGINGIGGTWLDLHQGIQLIREGRLVEAEETLGRIPPEAGIWQAGANIGRLLEARRSNNAALEYYEIASGQEKSPKDEALIQLRIARCLGALGRDRESRRVLEYAQERDGENLNIRLELRRLDYIAIY